tara:strand:- start:95 stop:319 length:225 start_codon:yes stop_codon:yes gene_type:complete
MKSLIEYTYKLILERRELKSELIKLRADLDHSQRKIERLNEEAEQLDNIDTSNTEELNRLRREIIDLRKQTKEW